MYHALYIEGHGTLQGAGHPVSDQHRHCISTSFKPQSLMLRLTIRHSLSMYVALSSVIPHLIIPQPYYKGVLITPITAYAPPTASRPRDTDIWWRVIGWQWS